MRRQYRKYAVWGAAFAVLITLGAATAAFTAGRGALPGGGDDDDRHHDHDRQLHRGDHDHDHHAGLDVELDGDGHDVHRHDDHRHDHDDSERQWRRWNCTGCDADEGGAEVHGVAVGDSASS